MSTPAKTKPTLSQLQKDALEVYRAKLELNLLERKKVIKAEINTKDNLRASIRTETNEAINLAAQTACATLYQPLIDGLIAVGFNVTLKLQERRGEPIRSYKDVPTTVTYTAVISQESAKPTATDRHSRDEFRAHERYPDEFRFMGMGRHGMMDPRNAALCYMYGEDMFMPPHMLRELERQNLLLITKDFTFTIPETLRASLITAETLREECDLLTSQLYELDRQIDKLPALERVFLAALAEDNLMRSKEGQELLAQLSTIPVTPTLI